MAGESRNEWYSSPTVDAAVEQLDAMLETTLAAKLNDPETTPRGLTLFFESAQTGSPQIQPGPGNAGWHASRKPST